MNNSLRKLAASLLATLFVALPLTASAAGGSEEAKLTRINEMLSDLRGQPDQGVPTWLLQRAYGVAVIPSVIQGGFIVAARHGKGALSIRDSSGRFSEPVFISLTGGSVGWQAGAQSADVVLIFATRRSVETFARGDFTLGGSAAVTAGPVGRQGEAAAGKESEVYAYTRTRGLFAGISLDGTALVVDNKANRNFYGRDVDTDMIANGKVHSNSESARRLISTLTAMAGGMGPAEPGHSDATSSTSSAPAPAPPAPQGGGAKTYPLEDSAPGAEPPR